MKKTTTYRLLLLFALVSILLLNACSSVKYVEDGKFLISRVDIKIDGKDITEKEINNNIVQRPNAKIFGFLGFNLGLYNMSGRDVEKWYNRWLRTIGEEPVIYDSSMADHSINQIKQYLNNKGYFDAIVSDTVVQIGKKKVRQRYNIKLGDAYVVDKYSLFTLDKTSNDDVETIKRIIKQDSLNSIIKENQNVSVDLIERERVRISRMLRNRGYYNFSERFLHCYIDSSFNDKKVKLFMSMNKKLSKKRELFTRYKIRSIDVKLQTPSLKAFVDDSEIKYDTVNYAEKAFLAEGKPYLRPKVLNSAIRFDNSEYYSVDKVEKTYSQLQSLKQFKFINIKFAESNLVGLDSAMYVDCSIDLRPLVEQSYSVALDGTSSSGNLGGAGRVSYFHRNLFGGAEDFSISFTGLYEKENYAAGEFYNKIEFGAETRLVSPQFLMPFGGLTAFRKKYSPKTAVSLGFNFQDNHSFKGKTFNTSFGYTWRMGKKFSFSYNLLDIDYIEMRDVDEIFLASLRNETARNSYKSHMVVASSIGFVYSDNVKDGFSNYVRLMFESAGNLADLVSRVRKLEPIKEYNDKGEEIGEHDEYWGIPYAQYLKYDFEYIFKYKLNKISSFAGRFFFGLGFPYGNMKVMPYEKMYFGGGANDIRAWHARTLGPGSSVSLDADGNVETNKLANKVSDLKIEANIEYRFKLFMGLEGALFIDAGNIWSVNSLETKKGADFSLSRFYKEIAVGTGLGFRYDFSFIVARFDVGLKVVDPWQPEGSRFIFLKKGYNTYDDMIFNIAIGYPF